MLRYETTAALFHHAAACSLFQPNQEDNCLLNYEDHRAEPQLFVNEPSQKVDYISIGMCQRQLCKKRDGSSHAWRSNFLRFSIACKERS